MRPHRRVSCVVQFGFRDIVAQRSESNAALCKAHSCPRCVPDLWLSDRRAMLQACRGLDGKLQQRNQRLRVLQGSPEAQVPAVLRSCVQHHEPRLASACLFHMQQALPENADEEASVADAFKHAAESTGERVSTLHRKVAISQERCTGSQVSV